MVEKTDLMVATKYKYLFDTLPDILVRSPGRINLIGEHTDYNMGLVMPAAIDKAMYFGMSLTDDSRCTITALDIDESVTFEKDDLTKSDRLWVNYFKGVIDQLMKRNIDVQGFNCVFSSDIPIGAGLSSSTAMDCGFIKGLDELLGLELNDWDIVNISNMANHQYLGVKGGILDQFAVIFGKKDKAMLMDCADQSYDYIDMDLQEYCLVLMNTNVKHQHLTSGYNDRAKECTEALQSMQKEYPQVKSLSDASPNMIEDDRVGLSEILKARAHFVHRENQRVRDFKLALDQHDMVKLGEILYASHDGLQLDYQVSCYELDVIVDISRNYDSILGARMMGGGFGGCVLILVEGSTVSETMKAISTSYIEKTKIEPTVFYVNISDGLSIVSNLD